MTICPIAIVAGCKKCPAFKICPLKGGIGDQPSTPEVSAKAPAQAAAKRPRKARHSSKARKVR